VRIDELDRLVADSMVAAIDAQPARLTRAGNPSMWPEERPWGKEVCGQLALRGVPADAAIDAEQLRPPTGDWNPPPGPVDLHPRAGNGDAGSLFIAELKLESINQSLWDTFKLAWVSEALGTGPQYLACAAHDGHWRDKAYGCELFPEDERCRILSSSELIEDSRDRWCWQWRHDTAKPVRIPSSIQTTPIVIGHRPAHYPQLELRVVRVAAEGPAKTDLTDGTPPGIESCDHEA
jgi:hypothetical protein